MQWIHISNAVPEIDVPVLVWNDTYNECEIRYRLNEFYPECIDIKNKYVWDHQGIINEIEYWMPLPIQPERSKREDIDENEGEYKFSGCTTCGDDFGQCDCQ